MIERKKRQSIRLPKYNYAQPGAYFVTIVTHHRKCFFGSLRNDEVFLSDIGRIVEGAWREIPTHFPHVTVDEYVIKPNHIHGIVNMLQADVGAPYMAPLRSNHSQESASPTLGIIIGTFKAAVTRQVHKLDRFWGVKIWHRNYYEHVIRDERDYERIIDYMAVNPENWEKDPEFLGNGD